jgi:proteic killer suppression protein
VVGASAGYAERRKFRLPGRGFFAVADEAPAKLPTRFSVAQTFRPGIESQTSQKKLTRALSIQQGSAGHRSITLDVNHARRYYGLVIKTFKCADTEALSKGRRLRRFVNIEAVARRKLRQLQIAGRLEDLRVPPGNRLETLKGERAGQHSIRVNDQFRVCFRWTAAGAEDVEIADYH